MWQIDTRRQKLNTITSILIFEVLQYDFTNAQGKFVVSYTYDRDATSINPYSVSLANRLSRITKEIASLRLSLPLQWGSSIFVCIDEHRSDVLKALIIGPEDSPYQNGTFIFDLFFPKNYPSNPPKVNLQTTGNGVVRFNPNLYNDGKVCLSILNTWEGRPEERWNSTFSLLQVKFWPKIQI